MSLFQFTGRRPAHLGKPCSQLEPCPGTPNCVSSLAERPRQKIAPLTPPVPAVQALESLHNLLRDMKEATIICHSDNYLYAEFRSSLMGYVDDVEFLIVAGSPGIQIRSAVWESQTSAQTAGAWKRYAVSWTERVILPEIIRVPAPPDHCRHRTSGHRGAGTPPARDARVAGEN